VIQLRHIRDIERASQPSLCGLHPCAMPLSFAGLGSNQNIS
jgi:hypothetical protein